MRVPRRPKVVPKTRKFWVPTLFAKTTNFRRNDFALIFRINRCRRVLTNGVEKSKIRLSVIGVQWAKVGEKGKIRKFSNPYIFPKWGSIAPIQKVFLSESLGLQDTRVRSGVGPSMGVPPHPKFAPNTRKFRVPNLIALFSNRRIAILIKLPESTELEGFSQRA